MRWSIRLKVTYGRLVQSASTWKLASLSDPQGRGEESPLQPNPESTLVINEETLEGAGSTDGDAMECEEGGGVEDSIASDPPQFFNSPASPGYTPPTRLKEHPHGSTDPKCVLP